MTIANVSQGNVCGLPQALRTAQEAIHFPEVQEMLRRLSEYRLGIFMPHMHDEQTGEFRLLPDQIMQVLVDKRIPGHGENVAELQKRKILLDGKKGALLLQIFSENQLGIQPQCARKTTGSIPDRAAGSTGSNRAR